MTTWIALLRGINVGGNNKLPMAVLRSELEDLGLGNVRSYIQSGNVVFDSPRKARAALDKLIADRVEEQHGFRPQVFLLQREQLLAAIEANPFRDAEAEPKTLHFHFLAEPATRADLAALDELKAPTESFHLTDSVFYLHAPEGIGRSKLAAKAERLLGVAATGRNFRTVAKLLELTED
ncbi:MAG: DUF1697 domain-containing protein [Planctomycetota bacterium]|nr:DUF1697 domain-containing protein [Planctomycetota bacterium]